MKVIHRLVGYDPKTDRMKLKINIADRLLGDAKRIAGVPDDDPDAAWSYPLSHSPVRAVATLIGAQLDPDNAEFFLEAFADRGRRPR
jgi:hypothetical protein